MTDPGVPDPTEGTIAESCSAAQQCGLSQDEALRLLQEIPSGEASTPVSQERLVKLAASDLAETWVRETLGRAGDDYPAVVLAAIARLLDGIEGTDAVMNDSQLREAFFGSALIVDAVMRFDEAPWRDWRHFVHAPLFVGFAQHFFRFRDRAAEQGEVSRDARFVHASSTVFMECHGEPEASPDGEPRDRSGVAAVTLMLALLRRHAHVPPDDVDVGRTNLERKFIPFEEWGVVYADFEPIDWIGYEGAYFDQSKHDPERRGDSDASMCEVDALTMLMQSMPYGAIAHHLMQAIEGLPTQQAKVLQATLNDTPSKEIAKDLGRTVSTVDNTRRQARFAVIAACVRKMGRRAFWEALPDGWKTKPVSDLIEAALNPASTVRKRRGAK